VIVVGAGMVGLACALALVQKGFQVVLLEAQSELPVGMPSETDPFDTRVVAISRATENFLAQLGVWALIKQSRYCAYQHMRIWDQVADGLIQFSAMDFFEPDLGHIIEQRVIKSALWQALMQHPACSIKTGTKITALQTDAQQSQLILQDGSVLSASLVIAADGAPSQIRNLCQIATTSWEYQQSAIVATVRGTRTHQATAYQRFSPDGPLALLPLADCHQSSIVWTTTPMEAKSLCALSASDFALALTREMDGVMGEMHLMSERIIFPLRTHHAKQYAVARCVLVGDAAHTLHPLAGQGVNLGFLDIIALVAVLEKTKARGRDFGALMVLKRYERARKLHNQMMIVAMELFKRGFGSRITIIQRLRNIGLNWVDNQKPLKQWFAKVALGSAQGI